MWWEKTFKISFAALGLILLVRCSNTNALSEIYAAEEDACLTEEMIASMGLVPAELSPIREQIALSGKIEYDQNNLLVLKNILDGIVQSVHFELGDQVKKGQTLAIIQSSQLLELTHLKKIKSQAIQLVEKQIETKRELLKSGLATALEVKELEAQQAEFKAELSRLQNLLTYYQSTGTKGQFKLIAPKSGYIVQKNISPGQILTTNEESVISISNLDEVWVFVNIYANNLRFVKENDKVQVKTIAFPDEIHEGRIDKIFNVFDENEHVLKARVVLKNSQLNLHPGLIADILIDKGESKDSAIQIPNHAVIFHNNKQYVLIHTSDCSIEKRRIHPVASNSTHVYVRGEILEGEKIVQRNALLLFEQLNA